MVNCIQAGALKASYFRMLCPPTPRGSPWQPKTGWSWTVWGSLSPGLGFCLDPSPAWLPSFGHCSLAAGTATLSGVACGLGDSRTCQTHLSGLLSLRAYGDKSLDSCVSRALPEEQCRSGERAATLPSNMALRSPDGHEGSAAHLQP